MAYFTGVCSSATCLFLRDSGSQTFWAAMILPYSECGCDSEVADTTFSTPKMSQALEHDQSECPVPLPLWLYLRLNTVAKFDQWYSSQNVGYFSASIKKETFFACWICVTILSPDKPQPMCWYSLRESGAKSACTKSSSHRMWAHKQTKAN